MSDGPAWLVVRGGVVHVRVRAKPRSARDAVEGTAGDRIAVRVTSPPVEGRANAAVEKALARALGVAPAKVSVVGGAGSRDKLVRVEGVAAGEAIAALEG